MTAESHAIGIDMLPAAQTCLVVAAHPDDIESWCAGTVRLLTLRGWRAVVVMCTSGEKGTSDSSAKPHDIALVRENEQRASCKILGADDPVFLRMPDGELEDTASFRGLIVRQIRMWRPYLVMTHDPVRPWPEYTSHRDHRVTGRVVLDAVYPYARDRLHFPEHSAADALEPHSVSAVWLFSSSQPDHWVDISSSLMDKIAARLAHVSQTSDAERLASDWTARAARVGAPLGIGPAEAFVQVQV